MASTVGIMSLRIIGVAPGCSEEEALPYAIKLGLALQLTNILRDVGEDWRAGRVYLPTDELAAFGLGDEDLARGQVDGRWRALMRFQIERTRTLYRHAWPCVAMFTATVASRSRRHAPSTARSWTRLKRTITTCSTGARTSARGASCAGCPASGSAAGSRRRRRAVQRYDFILAGGGAAGRSLAYHLARSPLRDRSILIVDRSLRARPDRTWAYWASAPGPFDALACRSWRRLLVAHAPAQPGAGSWPISLQGDSRARFLPLHECGAGRAPRVDFLQGRVERIEDGPEAGRVTVDGREYEGRWVFDSRFRWAGFHPDPRRYQFLRMQFRGWEIATGDPRFDPHTPTFLDFRTPQRGQMRFMYVLPYAPERALVEYVVCAGRLIHQAEQQRALAAYVGDILGITQYEIVAQEHGVSPMTDYPFPRRLGRRVMTIGVPAGMLKPTTGFAFTRIQRDSAAIVRSLLEHEQPERRPGPCAGLSPVRVAATARHGPAGGPYRRATGHFL